MKEIRSEVYNALANIMFKTGASKEEMDAAIEGSMIDSMKMNMMKIESNPDESLKIKTKRREASVVKNQKVRKIIMIYAIYRLSQLAIATGMEWEEAEANDEIEIIEEFETLEECEAAWNSGWYDDEVYGYGALLRTTYIF